MDNENQFSQLFNSLLFPKIFKSFRLAIQPSKIIIAFGAIALLYTLGWFMDLSGTVAALPDCTTQKIIHYPTQSIQTAKGRVYLESGLVSDEYPTELHRYLADPQQVKSFVKEYKDKGKSIGVAYTLWHFCAARFNEAVSCLFQLNFRDFAVQFALAARAMQWALTCHPLHSIPYFIIVLAVISIAGGAICRITARQFASDENPGLLESMHFSSKWKNFISFFSAPLAPIGIIVLFGLFVFLLGLIGNIPWAGELIISICLIIALIVGILITLVLIGAIAGFNLMFPAVAYENCDGFDAISRSFSYVYAKPWRMAFYTAVAAFYGAVCYMFVRFFAFLLLAVTYEFLQLGLWVNSTVEGVGKLAAIWPRPSFTNLLGPSAAMSLNWSESFSAFLVRLAVLVIVGLVASFVISFYFSANAVIYPLMRKLVDNTNLDEISTEAAKPEPDKPETAPKAKTKAKKKTKPKTKKSEPKEE